LGFGDLFKRLLGSGEAAAPRAESVEYQGYSITPTPMAQGGQYLTAGIITKDTPEGRKEHRFIRADTHASAEAAASFAVRKGQQIIDELGDRIFKRER